MPSNVRASAWCVSSMLSKYFKLCFKNWVRDKQQFRLVKVCFSVPIATHQRGWSVKPGGVTKPTSRTEGTKKNTRHPKLSKKSLRVLSLFHFPHHRYPCVGNVFPKMGKWKVENGKSCLKILCFIILYYIIIYGKLVIPKYNF